MCRENNMKLFKYEPVAYDYLFNETSARYSGVFARFWINGMNGQVNGKYSMYDDISSNPQENVQLKMFLDTHFIKNIFDYKIGTVLDLLSVDFYAPHQRDEPRRMILSQSETHELII